MRGLKRDALGRVTVTRGQRQALLDTAQPPQANLIAVA